MRRRRQGDGRPLQAAKVVTSHPQVVTTRSRQTGSMRRMCGGKVRITSSSNSGNVVSNKEPPGSPTPATTAYGRRHDTDVRPKFSASCQITAELHVSYTHYSFLTASKLHAIPPQDVNFLESQGCLHVPVRPLLDDFVQAYFLHVHVTLPILNEGDFWDMYFQNDKPGGSREQISLLVFRAILYASCNVSPMS